MDLKPSSVQSLRPLGAVPVKNAKGEITMEKVKVQRYVSGRKPKYAKDSDTASSASEESDDDLESNNRKILPSLRRHQSGSLAFTLGKTNSTISEDEDDDDDEDEDEDDDVRLRIRKNKAQESISVDEEKLNEDPRMRRLKQFREKSKDESIRPTFQPQIIKSGLKNDENKSDNDDDDDDDDLEEDEDGDLVRRRRRHREVIDAEADDDDENDDENIERRHELLKQKLSQIELEEASADKDSSEEEEEDGEEGEDEESEYESEYSEDEAMPRLKPIFVSKKDRITINEKEEEEKKKAEAVELEAKLGLEERRKATLKMIEEDRRREEEEMEKSKAAAEEEAIIKGIAAIVTDDEDEETAFELWKVRELRRIKRDKEEEEQREQERREIERLRNMSEEERQEELKKNPRQVTNQQKRGKFRFLQKYYHRGAFYLDVEDDVLKRDFAQPTLEDHFDKSVLPSVMQVKNFGRAGRTKYTHLSDVDTTAFDSAWSAKDNVHAVQFHQSHGGGMKQSFNRPGKRKK